jgi:hypothetical protein
VAHACNPSNSGGRDQEDHGSKPAQAKKIPPQKRAGGVAQGPEFKPQYCKKKKKSARMAKMRTWKYGSKGKMFGPKCKCCEKKKRTIIKKI